jgi:hypothetical protein
MDRLKLVHRSRDTFILPEAKVLGQETVDRSIVSWISHNTLLNEVKQTAGRVQMRSYVPKPELRTRWRDLTHVVYVDLVYVYVLCLAREHAARVHFHDIDNVKLF